MSIEVNPLRYAEGSCRIRMGETEILCAASFTAGVPGWRRGTGKGWITAEYNMLPRSGMERVPRSHQTGGRAQEIQRLISRSLRAAIDLEALGENTIVVDCDVIEADGGTRTAAITGGMVALARATRRLQSRSILRVDPIHSLIAAVSVGVVDGVPLLDLAYVEDSQADVDMNVIMTEGGRYIEVQGTAEGAPFTGDELQTMLALGSRGIEKLAGAQRAALEAAS
jgi:ribonuclease PH